MNSKEKKVKSVETNWPTSIEIKSPDSIVELKTFTVDDAPKIFSLIDNNREHLTRFEKDKETSIKYPNLEATVLSITKPRNPNKRRFAIRNQSGEFVGSINLTPDVYDPTSAEVGYYLGSEYTGNGYMTESVKALTNYAFDVLGCKKIYGKVVNGNDSSVQVLKRCGFIETGKTEENETVLTRTYADYISETSDPILRLQTLATLWTRVASGMELEEIIPSDIGMKSRSDPWNEANKNMIEIAKVNSKEGLRLARTLIELPETDKEQQMKVNQWMATSGLMLLGLDEMKEELSAFLSNDPNSENLAMRLKKLMEVDISSLKEKSDFDGNPTGYSTVQAIYIGLGLKDGNGKLSKVLYEEAVKRATDSDVRIAYGVISNFSDCVYLKTRFE